MLWSLLIFLNDTPLNSYLWAKDDESWFDFKLESTDLVVIVIWLFEIALYAIISWSTNRYPVWPAPTAVPSKVVKSVPLVRSIVVLSSFIFEVNKVVLHQDGN